MRRLIVGGLIALVTAISAARADPIKIVAAENFYGDIAKQIGGPDVAVTSILSNPDQDPHLFEVSPSVGRTCRPRASSSIAASIMTRGWRSCSGPPARPIARRSSSPHLVGRKTGDNPHIWYDPATMLALAKASPTCSAPKTPPTRPNTSSAWRSSTIRSSRSSAKIARTARAAGRHARHRDRAGLRLHVRGARHEGQEPAFQLAVMNDTEPSASDIAAFENDLKTHRVKLLVYNSQATGSDRRADAADRRGVGGARRRGHRDRTARRDVPELDDGRARRRRSRASQAGREHDPVNAIEFCDVTLRLGGRDVLAGVSLEIAAGEFVGVLGPNGGGKTTLMRAVLGLVPASSGSIRVLGRPAARGNPAIGYMPQMRSAEGNLRLSGRDFVAAVVAGHRLGLPFPGRAARAEVDRVLDLVGAGGWRAAPWPSFQAASVSAFCWRRR